MKCAGVAGFHRIVFLCSAEVLMLLITIYNVYKDTTDKVFFRYDKVTVKTLEKCFSNFLAL